MVLGGAGCCGRVSGDDQSLVRLTMTRQEIADYLGLTIETVCRVISAMKKQGILGIPNLQQFVVKKVDALYAIAGGEAPSKGS